MPENGRRQKKSQDERDSRPNLVSAAGGIATDRVVAGAPPTNASTGGRVSQAWRDIWQAKDPAVFKPDPQEWIKATGISTTAEVEVPTRLIDQVLGQEKAVAAAVKAAEQRRHLLLIGDPGTGKSMLAKAMAEVLPAERQVDALVFHNPKNPNVPRVVTYEGGTGRERLQKIERKAKRRIRVWRAVEWLITAVFLGFGFYLYYWKDETILTLLFILLVAMIFIYFMSQNRPKAEFLVPKLLIEHSKEAERAPYIDATGSHAGALLGDVRHDPYQSGGLETPPHVRVEIGAIHRAHRGVLFIDEINVLRLPSQQALLTALQEKQYAITGQSQQSAGAIVRTDPVVCDFVLVAAGNLDAVAPLQPGIDGGMHPALRSRIRGYGYEVYVNSVMDDTHRNRLKLIQFVAQEVVRDGRIPHFSGPAVAEVIREAQRRSGQQGKLTLRLRELGGLVRSAGDSARGSASDIVSAAHVREAKVNSQSLEQQITETEIVRRMSKVATADTTMSLVGVANGSALVGTGEVGEPAGLVVPVEAAVLPAFSRTAGGLVLGDGLKEIRGSGVENVAAVLKLLKGPEVSSVDLHVDATINHPDASGAGVGIAAAVASISALEGMAVKQDVVMIGSIAITGDLRPVDATLQRIETAVNLGYQYAIVPETIRQTLLLDDVLREKIQVLYCRSLVEVLDHVLDVPVAAKKTLLETWRRAATQRATFAVTHVLTRPRGPTNGASGVK